MRRVAIVVAAAVMLASAAMAQDGGGRESRRARAASGPAGEQVVERLLTELNLSEDQQKTVRQIFDTQKQAVSNWRKENMAQLKDLHKQVVDARENGDQTKLDAAQKSVQKILESRKALHENLIKQSRTALTPDQLAKAQKLMGRFRDQHPGVGLMEEIKKLNLSDDQKKQAMAIWDKAQGC